MLFPVPLVAGPTGPVRVQSKPVLFVAERLKVVDAPTQIARVPVAAVAVGVFKTVTLTGADVLLQPYCVVSSTV